MPHIFGFFFNQHIKYHILNMLMKKCDINQQYLKQLTNILSNMNNFHSPDAIHNFKWMKIQIEKFGG